MTPDGPSCTPRYTPGSTTRATTRRRHSGSGSARTRRGVRQTGLKTRIAGIGAVNVLLIRLLLVATCLVAHARSMTPEQWKRRTIYQLLTDRYAPTNAQDEVACDYTSGVFCGGTWQGIIRRLDHIQSLGFDAVWISPVVKNIEEFTQYGYGWHGYWAQDLYSLNPHFGTNADLLALSQALHSRGMALMVDVVANHMGSPSGQVDYAQYTPFNQAALYHPQKLISNYDNQTDVEQGWLGDASVPLPDIDTENVQVAQTLYDWVGKLVQTYAIDGLRLDTVKHVRKEFWPAFVQSAGVFSLGEVFSGDPAYLSAYQPYTGGLLDYATFYPLRRAFAPQGSMYELAALTAPAYRAQFTDVQLLGTFLENHDNPRFPTINADPAVIRNALAYTMLSDGIPILYQGQEYGFSGGDDPANREYLWKAGWRSSNFVPFLTLMNKVRRAAYNAGFGTNLTSGLYVNTSILASQKGPVLSVLSNAGASSGTIKVSVPTMFGAGTQLVDVSTCESFVTSKQSLNLTVVAGEPRILLPLGLAQSICNARPMSSSFMTRVASIFSSSRSVSLSNSMATSYSSGVPAKTTSGNGVSARSSQLSASALSSPSPSSSPYALVPMSSATNGQTTATARAGRTFASAPMTTSSSSTPPTTAPGRAFGTAAPSTMPAASKLSSSLSSSSRAPANAPSLTVPSISTSSSRSPSSTSPSATSTGGGRRFATNTPASPANAKRSTPSNSAGNSPAGTNGQALSRRYQPPGAATSATEVDHRIERPPRQATLPPVSASRQYRGVPLAGRSPQPAADASLWQRSNSESNLLSDVPKPLRRQGSSQSLRDPLPSADQNGHVASSGGSGRAMSLKDNASLSSMRAALFDDRNPYAPQPHAAAGPYHHSQPHSRAHSRRSSVASSHSYTGSTRADPRQQRQHLLSQESLALTPADYHHAAAANGVGTNGMGGAVDTLPQSQPVGLKRIHSRTALHQELRGYQL